MLAYEVARQLQVLGRDVAFVGVIDSTPHDPAAGAAANPVAFLKNVGPWLLDEIQQRGLASLADRLSFPARQLASRLFGRARRKEGEVRAEDLYEYWAVPEPLRGTLAGYLVASIGYRPLPSTLNVVLFAARIRPPHSLNPGRVWLRLAGHLRVYSLDGTT